jgi:putative multiple sugar transport system ATP-binding protein
VVDANKEFTVAEQYRKSLRTKTPSVEEGVAKLSGGNQQKVVLAKWMFTDPDLLILDEPTRGIDVGAKYEIYGIIQQLANQGKGVIVISSELPELLGLSDRIYTIFEGAITGVLDKDEASQESLMKLMTSARKPPDPQNPPEPSRHKDQNNERAQEALWRQHPPIRHDLRPGCTDRLLPDRHRRAAR